jgi:hypothetical protein
VGGVLLLIAIVCLIVFVTVPLPDALTEYYVLIFAVQIVVVVLQLFLLWLFRSRISATDLSRAMSGNRVLFLSATNAFSALYRRRGLWESLAPVLAHLPLLAHSPRLAHWASLSMMQSRQPKRAVLQTTPRVSSKRGPGMQ